jgi:ornithine cyclodeaminase/alanine dehydrogenase-like protein (mu-crystallin family)
VDGALNRTTHWTELGEVLSGSLDGRTSSEQTTVFKSVGVGFEDNAALLAVYRRAVEQDRGTVIRLG